MGMAVQPIRIVPLRLEAAAPVVRPQLTYRSGPLLASVEAFLFFWGDAWQQAPQSALVQQLNDFFVFVLASPLMDQLSEYSTLDFAITHGSRSGAIALTTAPPPSVEDADIQRFVQEEIASDPAVPQPTTNSLYFVFLPPGVTVGLDGGSSCVSFCGYHSAIDDKVFYAVMPFPDCGGFTGGNGVALAASPNPPPKDPDHRHAAWLTRDKTAPRLAFPQSDIASYWGYARQFTLCDNYYTDVAGPSTPNHLMLIMADSKLVDNPSTSYRKHPGPPLYDQPSLPSQLDAARLSWTNYNGYAFEFIKYTAGKKRPWQQFATDAAAGKLPSVSWLYADEIMSEHPADTATQRAAGAGDVNKGSQWTASQVRAVVSAGLWAKVAIFITWDDWGGWWDHVAPPEVEKWKDGTQFRFGGRGGCLVLSPYARAGYVSKALHSHVSLVKFCQANFGLPSLNARTKASDAMEDCFDLTQKPLPPPH